MKRHLNTLFITTEDMCLAKEGQALVVRAEKETRLRVPLHQLGSVVCLGRVLLTQPAIAACATEGVSIALHNRNGRFLARVTGPTSGNVLLRRQQYRYADCPEQTTAIAVNIVAAKVANSRAVLMRHLRDYGDTPCVAEVRAAVDRLSANLDDIRTAGDTDRIRGLEGDSARTYFDVFDKMILTQKDDFRFTSRSRRPPLDRVNSILSFLYAMLANDAASACEAVGLDPAVGFLHRDRPGRPGLGLDLMEELRAFLADRLALSLINRRQISGAGFSVTESGAVEMDDDTRKAVVVAYQKRKQQTITHPFLRESVTVGLLLHLQARLLARYIRGELDGYPPFLWK